MNSAYDNLNYQTGAWNDYEVSIEQHLFIKLKELGKEVIK